MGRSLRCFSLTWGILQAMKRHHFCTKHITSPSTNWRFSLALLPGSRLLLPVSMVEQADPIYMARNQIRRNWPASLDYGYHWKVPAVGFWRTTSATVTISLSWSPVLWITQGISGWHPEITWGSPVGLSLKPCRVHQCPPTRCTASLLPKLGAPGTKGWRGQTVLVRVATSAHLSKPMIYKPMVLNGLENSVSLLFLPQQNTALPCHLLSSPSHSFFHFWVLSEW